MQIILTCFLNFFEKKGQTCDASLKFADNMAGVPCESCITHGKCDKCKQSYTLYLVFRLKAIKATFEPRFKLQGIFQRYQVSTERIRIFFTNNMAAVPCESCITHGKYDRVATSPTGCSLHQSYRRAIKAIFEPWLKFEGIIQRQKVSTERFPIRFAIKDELGLNTDIKNSCSH